ncbi:hypothetical protein SBRY_20624 [Actinacidiphila bryophytorum]|uniref:Uncharacterized protein n=1 Tax=Actinacidiphila bryophytorum TaxID=1436133 RepID=A0A9W4H034_9ACTN|nr:hypothetical protein SBRY_20624 [Actinacidiphila bryophytorum]
MLIWEYDGWYGTSSDDVGRVQRDSGAAAAGDSRAVAGGGAGGDGCGAGVGDQSAGGVEASAGASGGGAGAGQGGREAAALRAGRAGAAADPRVGRRLRAVLEREFRPAGRLRAGPEADTSGGVTDGRGKAGSAGGGGGRPGDRGLPGHRRTAGPGVRGVHRGAAPGAVVGACGLHHDHAVLRLPRGRGVGLRPARS